MRTPSMGSSSRRSFGHRRIIDILADDQESDDEGIAPVFLSSDGSDLVEVMLELDHDSMVLRSVATVPPDTTPTLSRSSSTTSRIRRKFSWLRSPSPRLSSASASANDFSAIAAARDARRAQARLARTRSGAKRALKGLKFISHTTSGSCGDPTDLWRRVEDRFNKLSRDGLLSRDDFGECIGIYISYIYNSLSLSLFLFSLSLSLSNEGLHLGMKAWGIRRSSRRGSSMPSQEEDVKRLKEYQKKSSMNFGSRSPIKASTLVSRSFSTCIFTFLNYFLYIFLVFIYLIN